MATQFSSVLAGPWGFGKSPLNRFSRVANPMISGFIFPFFNDLPFPGSPDVARCVEAQPRH